MKSIVKSLLCLLSGSLLWSCQAPTGNDLGEARAIQSSSSKGRVSTMPPYMHVLTKPEAVEMVEQDERNVLAASSLRQVLGHVISIDHSTRFKLPTEEFQALVQAIDQNATSSTVVMFLNGLMDKTSLGRGRTQFGKECLHIVGFDVISQKIVYDDEAINRTLNNGQLCTWNSTEIRLERDELLHRAKIRGFNPQNNQNGTIYEVKSALQFADLLAKKGNPFVYFDFGYNATEDRGAIVLSNAADYRQNTKNARSATLEEDTEAFGNRGHSCCIKTP